MGEASPGLKRKKKWKWKKEGETRKGKKRDHVARVFFFFLWFRFSIETMRKRREGGQVT
jgi:hypothetical protein